MECEFERRSVLILKGKAQAGLCAWRTGLALGPLPFLSGLYCDAVALPFSTYRFTPAGDGLDGIPGEASAQRHNERCGAVGTLELWLALFQIISLGEPRLRRGGAVVPIDPHA